MAAGLGPHALVQEYQGRDCGSGASKAFNFSSLSMLLVVGLSYTALLCQSMFPPYPLC